MQAIAYQENFHKYSPHYSHEINPPVGKYDNLFGFQLPSCLLHKDQNPPNQPRFDNILIIKVLMSS